MPEGNQTPSRRSLRSTSRPNSLASRRRNSLTQIHSAQAFDDHHVYSNRSSSEFEEYFSPETESNHDHASLTPDVEKGSIEDGERKEEVEEDEEKECDPTSDRWGSSTTEETQRKISGPELRKARSTRSGRSSRSNKDPNLVTWDGPDDPKNPKNWGYGRKWVATVVVSSFTFMSPVASSMVAPAFHSVAEDLHVTSILELNLMLSVFVLAYAIGPLFLGPLSEVYGRVRVLQLANLFFLAWNIGCGFAQTKAQLIVFRFLAGLGGSAPLTIGGGVLGDCWSADERGKAISIYAVAPLVGPAVGPIAGGFITQYTTWRWTFWATSIATGVIQLSGLLFLQETYTPQLLKKKAQKLRKETGNNALYTEYEFEDIDLAHKLRTALGRPFVMLGTQPIIQVIALYMAYIYGLVYLFLSTFPDVWRGLYNESPSIGGLNYISLGIGFVIGTQIQAPFTDRTYRKLKQRNNGVGKPEFRIPLMYLGSALLPVGIFWYGWSAGNIHWIMPNIGAAIFAAATVLCFQCMQAYIVDAYTRYAASGLAAAVVLRSIAGFGFPLFAPAMFDALGYGWGNTVLGCCAIVIGIPAPFMFSWYGEKLRQKSQYATG